MISLLFFSMSIHAASPNKAAATTDVTNEVKCLSTASRLKPGAMVYRYQDPNTNENSQQVYAWDGQKLYLVSGYGDKTNDPHLQQVPEFKDIKPNQMRVLWDSRSSTGAPNADVLKGLKAMLGRSLERHYTDIQNFVRSNPKASDLKDAQKIIFDACKDAKLPIQVRGMREKPINELLEFARGQRKSVELVEPPPQPPAGAGA